MPKPWENFEGSGDLPISLEDLLKPAGAPQTEVLIYDVREITPSDLLVASHNGGLVDAIFGSGKTIKNLRSRHHRVAQLLAQNLSGSEVCLITGLSRSRLDYLLEDQSFKELVSHYQEVAREAHQDLIDQMATLAHDATSELHDRLEDNPENIDTPTLLDIIKVTADRTGAGPTSKNMTLVGKFEGDALANFKSKINEKEKLRLVKPTEGSPPINSLGNSERKDNSPHLLDPTQEVSSEEPQVGHLPDPGPRDSQREEEEGEEPQGPPQEGPPV